jgi:hypothetical protein
MHGILEMVTELVSANVSRPFPPTPNAPPVETMVVLFALSCCCFSARNLESLLELWLLLPDAGLVPREETGLREGGGRRTTLIVVPVAARFLIGD